MGAERALREALVCSVAFAIFKDGSPSCGVNCVHDGTFTGTKIPGMGIAAALVAAAGFNVFSEDELELAACLHAGSL
jgi:uncharacterized protein YbbK (DUF523 family)